MTPRPHAEIIRAWADGNDVQYRRPGSNEWVDSPDPAFVSDYIYRVKPEKVYPQSRMSYKEFSAAFDASNSHLVPFKLQHVANEAIRHAIDNGQVVTREDFATLLIERDRAVLTLLKARYTDEGGELWKPPLGRTVAGTQRLVDCLRTIRKLDKESVSAIVLWIDGEQVPLGAYITSALKAAGTDVN